MISLPGFERPYATLQFWKMRASESSQSWVPRALISLTSAQIVSNHIHDKIVYLTDAHVAQKAPDTGLEDKVARFLRNLHESKIDIDIEPLSKHNTRESVYEQSYSDIDRLNIGLRKPQANPRRPSKLKDEPPPKGTNVPSPKQNKAGGSS